MVREVLTAYKDYPVQMCHFHQKRIIQRYITLNPKLEASQVLGRKKFGQRTHSHLAT